MEKSIEQLEIPFQGNDEQFDQALWYKVLKMKQELEKADSEISIRKVKEAFGISYYKASLYVFAVRNFKNMFEDTMKELDKRNTLNKLREEKRLNNKLQTMLNIAESTISFMQGISEVNINTQNSPVLAYTKDYDPLQDVCVALTILSDVHFDGVVRKNVVLGLNEYNPEIATTRLNHYFRRLVWLVNNYKKSCYNIKGIVMMWLGDFITGYIHEELKYSNSMSPVESILEIQRILLQGVRYVLENTDIEKLDIICIPGNHGRTTEKMFLTDSYRFSYEWSMYNNLKQHELISGTDKITMTVPNSEFAFYNLFDKVIRMSHGHHFRYEGGVGGLYVPLMRHLYRARMQIPFDRAYMGHWHMEASLPEVGINGSVIGIDAYSLNKGFYPQRPSQLMEIFSSKKQAIVNHTPILLDDF